MIAKSHHYGSHFASPKARAKTSGNPTNFWLKLIVKSNPSYLEVYL